MFEVLPNDYNPNIINKRENIPINNIGQANHNELMKHSIHMNKRRRDHFNQTKKEEEVKAKELKRLKLLILSYKQEKIELIDKLKRVVKTNPTLVPYSPCLAYFKVNRNPKRFYCDVCGRDKTSIQRKRIISGDNSYVICKECLPEFKTTYQCKPWSINRRMK